VCSATHTGAIVFADGTSETRGTAFTLDGLHADPYPPEATGRQYSPAAVAVAVPVRVGVVVTGESQRSPLLPSIDQPSGVSPFRTPAGPRCQHPPGRPLAARRPPHLPRHHGVFVPRPSAAPSATGDLLRQGRTRVQGYRVRPRRRVAQPPSTRGRAG
jgi:hypothetical protein